MPASVFFDGWSGLARVIVVGAAAYVALVLMLRISGKRTLSKLNAFDFVVTIALGSTLASILTSRSVPLAEGLTALALLIGLQFVVTWTAVRLRPFDRIVKSEPSVVLRHGEPVRSVMKRQRVTEDEILSAVRDRGGRHLADADLVLLESDGTLTALLSASPPTAR